MKQLNFLSSLGSQSMGHRVTTLALTVGSPSAHRRGVMLKLIPVLVLILTFGIGNVWGAENDTHDFTQTLSQLLNNKASIADVTVAEQSYTVKSVIVTVNYNKTAGGATVSVKVGGTTFGSAQTINSSTTTTFTYDGASAVKGQVVVSSVNNCSSGTGKGTFKITNVRLVEGPAAGPADPFTVTLMDNGATLTEESAGDGVILPSREGCSGYTFAGWTKSWNSAQTEWTTTAPTIIPAGSYTPTADENLYPVFTKTESGGTTYQFQKVTALSQINAGGTFVISNGNYYLPNTGTSSAPTLGTMPSVTGNVITGTVTNAMKWSFSAADKDNHVTITSVAEPSKYLYTISNNNGLRVNSTSDSWTFEEYTVSSILGFAMKSTSQSRYCATYNSQDWRSYTSRNHGNYGVNSGRLDVYKEIEVSSTTTSYISVPNCCTPLGSINGSFFWPTLFTYLTC